MISGKLSPPSAAAVDAAVKAVRAKKLSFFTSGPYCTHYAAAPATTTLAHNAFAGDTSQDGLVLDQARHLLSESGFGERGPNFGIAWYSQSPEATWCAFLAYLPYIERLWSKLTSVEKDRADFMMTVAPIVAVWHASKDRPMKMTVDGGTLSTGENPNLDSSWIAILAAAVAYWETRSGGKGLARVTEILRDVSISNLQKQAGTLGLTSIQNVLKKVGSGGAPSAAQIESAVSKGRLHYRIKETFGAGDVIALVRERTLHFFSKTLEPGQNGGKGIDGRATVSNGVAAYPYSGIGDAFEYDGQDDGGVRSSGTYVAEGMRHIVHALLMMVIAGYWNRDDPENKAVVRRLRDGTNSCFWKWGRSESWKGGAAERYYLSLAHNKNNGGNGGHSENTGFDETKSAYGISGSMSVSYGLESLYSLVKDVLVPWFSGKEEPQVEGPEPKPEPEPLPEPQPDPLPLPSETAGPDLVVTIGQDPAQTGNFGYIKGKFGAIANGVNGDWEVTEFYNKFDSLRLRLEYRGALAQLPGVAAVAVPITGIGSVALSWATTRYITDGPAPGIGEAMVNLLGKRLVLAGFWDQVSGSGEVEPAPEPGKETEPEETDPQEPVSQEPDPVVQPDPEADPDDDLEPGPDPVAPAPTVTIGRHATDASIVGYVKGQFGAISNAVKGDWELTEFLSISDRLRIGFAFQGETAEIPGVTDLVVPLEGVGDITLSNSEKLTLRINFQGKKAPVLTVAGLALPFDDLGDLAVSWTSTRYSTVAAVPGLQRAMAGLQGGDLRLPGLLDRLP
jgi:hypothetical protein